MCSARFHTTAALQPRQPLALADHPGHNSASKVVMYKVHGRLISAIHVQLKLRIWDVVKAVDMGAWCRTLDKTLKAAKVLLSGMHASR